MSLLAIVSIVFLITAVISVINHRFIKWPPTIAVMVISTILSLIFVLLQQRGVVDVSEVAHFMETMKFDRLLLNWLLPVLLFSGALNISIDDLRDYRIQIFTYATLSLLLSAIMIAGFISYAAPYLGFEITFLQSMVFGVLISSTDPVCIIGMLKTGNISRSLKSKIMGESLFNDGTAVVLFLTLVSVAFVAPAHAPELNLEVLVRNFFYESLGGLFLGIATAYVASLLTRTIDAYDIEIMITLALAFGTFALSQYLHVSGPIAVVVAGLYIGNTTVKRFMSNTSREHVKRFWSLVDNISNAVLFSLMGLVFVLFDLNKPILILSSLSIVAMLVARYFSILGASLTLLPLKYLKMIDKVDFKKTPLIMTWGGLRGGISIALALSIPNTYPQVKEVFLTMTFVCVFFSVLVQGLTLPKLMKVVKKDNEETTKEHAPGEKSS